MPVVSELPKGLEERDFQHDSPEKKLGVKIRPLLLFRLDPSMLVVKRIVLQ